MKKEPNQGAAANRRSAGQSNGSDIRQRLLQSTGCFRRRPLSLIVSAQEADMDGDELFLSEQHAISQRWAILEDDGCVAWMYLTEPGSEKPVADCWLYNRVQAPPSFNSLRGEAPVAPATYVQSIQPFAPPKAESVSFRWSSDGESVAVLFQGELVGFIAANQRLGFSKNLHKTGPFGSPLNHALYEQLFAVR